MKKKNVSKTYESSWMGEKDSCKFRSEATTRSGIFIYWVRGIWLLSGKSEKNSQVILKCEVCGNRDCEECVRLIKWIPENILCFCITFAFPHCTCTEEDFQRSDVKTCDCLLSC